MNATVSQTQLYADISFIMIQTIPSKTVAALKHSRFLRLLVMLLVLSASSSAEDRQNVLLICVDDLRPELNCFGKGYIQSPNIDALAASGRAFHRHYVQAPTCGASRFALLTGQYGPSNNDALFKRSKRFADSNQVPPSMPGWFQDHGYTTVSVGKVSHHPGGRGGPDWNDDKLPEMPGDWNRHLLPAGPWLHPRGAMHGLANGEIRRDPAEMDLFQSSLGNDKIYPDGLITERALSELDQLASHKDKPFFLAVGIIRPHLPFGAPAKYMNPYADADLPAIPHPEKPTGKTTWHRSNEFMRYNRWDRDPNLDAEFATQVRKHYAACVTYADAMVGQVLSKLDQLGLRENTIIVLWGDHGWHLGEHAVWGKHTLFEESLRSPLIVSYPGITKPGQPTSSMVETIDVFPTLCDLARLPTPEFTHGASLKPILDSPNSPGHDAISYAKAKTIRNDSHRLIVHADGHKELYDQSGTDRTNMADQHQELVDEMHAKLKARLSNRIKY